MRFCSGMALRMTRRTFGAEGANGTPFQGLGFLTWRSCPWRCHGLAIKLHLWCAKMRPVGARPTIAHGIAMGHVPAPPSSLRMCAVKGGEGCSNRLGEFAQRGLGNFHRLSLRWE